MRHLHERYRNGTGLERSDRRARRFALSAESDRSRRSAVAGEGGSRSIKHSVSLHLESSDSSVREGRNKHRTSIAGFCRILSPGRSSRTRRSSGRRQIPPPHYLGLLSPPPMSNRTSLCWRRAISSDERISVSPARKSACGLSLLAAERGNSSFRPRNGREPGGGGRGSSPVPRARAFRARRLPLA